MPTLVFPFTLADGDVSDGPDVMTLIQPTTDVDESLSIINGYLDTDNLGFTLTSEYMQRGSSIDAHQRARTTNLDWTWRLFGEYTTTDVAGIEASRQARAIPGSNWTGNVRWDGLMLVTWTIFLANDLGFNTDDEPDWYSTVLLVLDGAVVDSQVRNVGNCVRSVGDDPRFYQKARVWTGHSLVEVGRGEHTVGLHIIADQRIRQTRTWAGSIRVIPFKWSAP